jgi:hypothetical protein
MSHTPHTQFDEGVIELSSELFDLARRGDRSTLQRYLQAGAPVNLTNTKGDTLLMLAAYHERSETVALLLEYGADADRTNDRGQTPLAAAVFRNDHTTTRHLLAAGANPAVGDPSALGTAVFFERTALLTDLETAQCEHTSAP